MKVLVLEDTIQHQVRIETALKEIAEELETVIEVTTTGKIQEFEEYVEADEINQLYFLDIDIKGEERKGFEVAQFIRAHNPYAVIVFVTTHSEFATMTYSYKVAALDFIEKEMGNLAFKERIKDCVEYTRQTLIENDQVVDYFEYDFRGSKFSIPYHDIYYIETTGVTNKLRVVGKNMSREFRGTLVDIMEKDQNSQHFFSPHKSFLANINHIQGYDNKNKEIVFYGGSRIPISRLKVGQLKKIMQEKEKK
ncbi:Response regulator of the competence regulon ComE [Streptococcus sp. DD10]|uniref:competence system response regulator transcription factor ComE n=1 Tax=Streptococcus sp. DD10 TaxID=1777878 RepID=UPI0007979CFB|nr:competence system response regulator transcription factor ComE [Streptococcus sp. DD10]KXT74275.1 Response regulator of the competence regulon ComE [Streptococcus sp. DD10]